MEFLKKVLTWLSGKKSSISACIGLVIAYLAVKSIIGEAEVVLYGGLNIIIFGGASLITGKIVYNK